MAKDPLTELLNEQGNVLEEIFSQAGTTLWEYRVELGWMLGIGGTYGLLFLATREKPVAALAILYVVVAGLLTFRPFRRGARRSLMGSAVRRRWDEAVRHCGFPHQIPITKVESIAAGHRARIRVGKGVSFVQLEQRREQLAASLAVRELRLKRDPHNASTGTVILVRSDPLADVGGKAWPDAATAERARRPRRRPDIEEPPPWYARGQRPDPPPDGGGGIWDPIPVGTDEHGERVTITLPERSVLIGGSPGSGKTNAMCMPLARAALDPSVHLYLIDGKAVDFVDWEDCAEMTAHTISDAVYLLERLQAEMDVRLRELRRRKLRKVPARGDLPLCTLFIDELALFTDNIDKKASADFTLLLTDLVARGRAPGIFVGAATQKPEGRVVSTNLRDLFAYRWALRCGSPEASDTILGRRSASQGYDASTIAPQEEGVGYLAAEDGIPRRIRSFYLDDRTVRDLAERATRGRRP